MDRTEDRHAADPADIELLVLDVDGVLTDGRVVLDADGREIKRFSVRDGAGLKYWQRAGGQVAILSGRSSPAVVARAVELGITNVVQNAKQKLPAYEALLERLGMTDARTAVMGDDLPDLPLLRRAGYALAPADAVEDVRAAADYVTAAAGGEGAVREAIEMLLKQAGRWDDIMARYRQETS